jgi:hypothetical protein
VLFRGDVSDVLSFSEIHSAHARDETAWVSMHAFETLTRHAGEHETAEACSFQ